MAIGSVGDDRMDAPRIRNAEPGDATLIATLVRELAAYERLEAEAKAGPEDFAAALFCASPHVFAVIVEAEGRPAGFALYFYSFSTFVGRAGLYLEDLFIRPEFRRRGFGRAIFEHLARKAVAEGCGRFEWSVLDWNEPAIRFYTGLGAVPMQEWTVMRLAGEALHTLAGQ
jgi:GNAT superfamily N-acetyltransferase